MESGVESGTDTDSSSNSDTERVVLDNYIEEFTSFNSDVYPVESMGGAVNLLSYVGEVKIVELLDKALILSDLLYEKVLREDILSLLRRPEIKRYIDDHIEEYDKARRDLTKLKKKLDKRDKNLKSTSNIL